MKILQQKIVAKEVMQMIDARLKAIQMQFDYAKADDKKALMESIAETKIQIAVLKMQFVDLLLEQAVNDE